MDFQNKQAVVTAEKSQVDPPALEAALKEAGFDGKVLSLDSSQKKEESSQGTLKEGRQEEQERRGADEGTGKSERRVVLRVTGMMKSKSGAT